VISVRRGTGQKDPDRPPFVFVHVRHVQPEPTLELERPLYIGHVDVGRQGVDGHCPRLSGVRARDAGTPTYADTSAADARSVTCASVLLLDGPTRPRAGLPRPTFHTMQSGQSGCSGTVLPPGSGDRSEKSPGIGAKPSAAKPGRRPIPRLYREDAEERRNLRVSREVPSNG
jgi:hypothetical protein